MALKPMCKWAQREDNIFFTIDLTDTVNPKIELTEDKLTFSGKGGSPALDYALEIEFNGPVVPADSKRLLNSNRLFFTIAKKEEGYWPRLLKTKNKEHWLKIDFAKWKDEDDDEEEAKPDNYDQPGMEGMGGMPGGMPGGGGMGGPGGGMPPGFDMEAMMKQMGMSGQDLGGLGAGGLGGDTASTEGVDGEEADSDDDAMPELE